MSTEEKPTETPAAEETPATEEAAAEEPKEEESTATFEPIVSIYSNTMYWRRRGLCMDRLL